MLCRDLHSVTCLTSLPEGEERPTSVSYTFPTEMFFMTHRYCFMTYRGVHHDPQISLHVLWFSWPLRYVTASWLQRCSSWPTKHRSVIHWDVFMIYRHWHCILIHRKVLPEPQAPLNDPLRCFSWSAGIAIMIHRADLHDHRQCWESRSCLSSMVGSRSGSADIATTSWLLSAGTILSDPQVPLHDPTVRHCTLHDPQIYFSWPTG